ncbi:hypothetical protein [Thioalkalivibrio nitratireducens]|nr:hypothetical protein [Thioalkalivibrio nitratireducens]
MRYTAKFQASLFSPFALLAFISLLKISLGYSYFVFVSETYWPLGFRWDPSAPKILESWVLLFALVRFSPNRLTRPSDYMIVSLICLSIIPLLSLYGLANHPRWPVYTVFVTILLILIFRRGRAIRMPYFSSGRDLVLAITVLGSLITTAWMIVNGGLAYFNLDFSLVYEFRSDVRDQLYTHGFQYFILWATKVLGPALLAFALWQKWWWVAAAVVALHVLWFGISSHKAVLFFPFIILSVWVWVRSRPALSIIPLALLIIVVSSLVVFLAFDQIMPASVFVHRLFFIPANNTFLYFEFFSNNPKVFWSNSVLELFLNYPYADAPGRLIGEFGGSGAFANNSFLSTGYMHGGFGGMVLYGVLVGLLFRVFDSFQHNGMPLWMSVAVLAVPTQALLISDDLFSSMFSHGIGLALLLLLLMRRRKSPWVAENGGSDGGQRGNFI